MVEATPVGANQPPARGSLAVPLFAPDTDLGRDLAAVDWAATPLGAPQRGPAPRGYAIPRPSARHRIEAPPERTDSRFGQRASRPAHAVPAGCVDQRWLCTDLVYRLRVIVDQPDEALRQGMPVTVRIPQSGTQEARDGHETLVTISSSLLADHLLPFQRSASGRSISPS